MKRTLLTLLAMLSIATVLAKDSYLPTCAPLREYIYHNEQGESWRENTFLSEYAPGYIAYNEDVPGFYKVLREDGTRILRNYNNITNTPEMLALIKENFTTDGNDFVYFDYNLQIGDTLCVVEQINGKAGYLEGILIDGKIIKVESIDVIEINAQPRVRYILETNDFSGYLEQSRGKESGDYLYTYSIERIGKTYSDSWIEGIGYTKNNCDYELQCVFEEGELIYGEEYVEERSYLPTCAPLREYIYYNEQGESWRENTFSSENYPGYIAYNDDYIYNKVLREQGTQILRNFDGLTTTPELIKLLNENLPTVNNDFVYFDYNLQVGDTLCVVYHTTSPTHDYEAHCLEGKIIKVLSIDTIESGTHSRLKYNLESRLFTAGLSAYCDASLPPNERVYEYTYSLSFGNTINDAWIEGIGYTAFIFSGDLDANFMHELQCVFEEGELIYCADGADCKGLSDNVNKKIDFTTLTLHRSGDALMAVFPTASAGETITLYDATGHVVATQPIRTGATTATIDTSALPTGVYIARLNSGATAKVVL
ncbi:MAG: T9SS type A sorting domain-containing protein [Bacteroidaceae bacterium]|nr:T9SS type A sorting domain-containing protein [Bacteroidaceae bacterium]